LQRLRPTSQIAAQTANRPPDDRTFLLRVAPIFSLGDNGHPDTR
jgi:hypothetical protein